MFLTAAQSKILAESIRKCLLHYCWLAKDSVKRGQISWNLVPKMHYWFHLSMRCRFINPRFQQTYINESMVGRICDIYKASMCGTANLKTIQHSVLMKYLTGLVVCFGAQDP